MMQNEITLADIICNMFSKNYSLDDSAADLGKIKMEIRRIELYEGDNSERLAELKRLESIQEKLTLFKLDNNNSIKEKLASSSFSISKHE